jgi:hypothetical protein
MRELFRGAVFGGGQRDSSRTSLERGHTASVADSHASHFWKQTVNGRDSPALTMLVVIAATRTRKG